MNTSPELEFLKKEVQRCYGTKIETSKDFESLSQNIEDTVGSQVSDSTLKRLWGYVSLNPRPRKDTLDILSRYAGRKDFRTLCLEIQEESDFFSANIVRSAELEAGRTVILKWHPDREVELKFLGGDHYQVIDGGTSKLRIGDILETSEFIKGQPLFIARIVRDGVVLPPYVSGKALGIISIDIT